MACEPESQPVRNGHFASPARLLFVTMTAVFVAELLFILAVPQLEPRLHALADAFVLSVVLLPVLYFSIYRPARRHATQRRVAGDALRVSEERYRLLAENAADVIWVRELDLSASYTSPSVERMRGFTAEEANAQTLDEIMPPDSARLARETLAHSVEWAESATPEELRQISETLELEVIRKDGSTVWTEVTTKFMTDPDGRPAKLIGISRDITERRQAREALQDSEEWFRQVFEQAGDAMMLADASTGRLLNVNERACVSLGYAREELLGLSVSEVDPAFLEDKLVKFMGSLEPGKPVTLETIHKRKDGSTFPVDVRAGLIEIGGQTRAFGVARDITERKRTEEAIVTVATGISSARGEVFVQSLVLALARALKADYAFVGELEGSDTQRIQSVAACADGQIVDNFQYDLRGAPCENVVGKTPCSYPSGVQQLFPRDRQLVKMNAEGYVGAPLFDGSGNAMGIAAVLYRREVQDVRFAESLLQVFALRAVTELERVRSERAAQESAERFQSLSEAAFEGIAITEGGVLLEANEQLARMLGCRLDDTIGMKVQDFVAPESLDLVRERIRSGFQEPYQHLARRKDGSIFPVEVQGRSMPYRGQTVRVTALRDITVRRKMEHALQESEAKYRTLFEQGSVAIFLLNDLRVVDCNSLAHEVFGCTREQFLGRTVRDFSPAFQPDGRPFEEAAQERATAALDGTPQRFEWLHHRLDGTPFHAGITLNRLELNGEPHLQVVLADITERKQSEEALRKSETRYRNLVETSQDLIWRVDSEGRFTYLNKTWERTLGFTVEEMLGRRFSAFQTTEVAARDTREFARRLADGGTVTGYETTYIAKSGDEVHLLFNAVPLVDGEGGIIGVQGTAYDVTHRKRAEEAVRSLRQRVLMAQEEERRHIARELHDELGQALTGVKMDLAWLKDRLPKNRPPLLERARESLSLIDATLDSVRDLSSRLRPAVLDDLGLASAIEWQARHFVRRTGVECDVSMDDRDLPLDGDRASAVFRVFQEALTNVARHAKASRVQARLGTTDGRVVLDVRDDGQGITEAQLAGTDSLGLVGMRERAAAFGGRVEVRCGEKGGTTVTLQMPLAGTLESGRRP